MGDTDGRALDDRAKVQCETATAWVIAAGGVDKEHVGELRQRSNRCFKQRTLPEGEEPGLIGGSNMAGDHGARRDSPIHS